MTQTFGILFPVTKFLWQFTIGRRGGEVLHRNLCQVLKFMINKNIFEEGPLKRAWKSAKINLASKKIVAGNNLPFGMLFFTIGRN